MGKRFNLYWDGERISGQVCGYDAIYEAGLVTDWRTIRRDAPLRVRECATEHRKRLAQVEMFI